MDVKYWLILFIIISIINVIVFTFIYKVVDQADIKNFNSALYLSVQISIGKGMSNFNEQSSVAIRDWITVQSTVTYIIDIFLVIFIGLFVGEVLSKKRINV